MTFKPYPKYKPSGVEWLGDVPKDWVETLIKYEASFFGGGTPSKDEIQYWNGDIPWVSPKDMKTELIFDTEDHVTVLGVENSAVTLLPPGCVLIVVRSGILKHTIPVALNMVAVTLNQDMRGVKFGSRVNSNFFLRWIQGNNRDLLSEWSKQGATVESIEHAYFANSSMYLPSIKVQIDIVAFLDRETAKIDALIAKQEAMISLLKEKRQAVISHSVTKGLDPSVPMKPSGVEWIGDVPEHWEIKRVKHFGKVIGGFAFKSSDFCEQGQPVIKISNVSHMTFEWSDQSFLPAEFLSQYEEYVAPLGSILFAMTRPLIAGGIKVAHLDSDERYLVNQRVGFIPGLSKVDALFILFSTQSSPFIAAFQNNTTMTNQPNISSEGIESIALPRPPIEERMKIVEFLQDQIKKTDFLIAKAQEAIALQEEHRTALIAAAVTGKIDVRDAVSDLQKAA